MKNDLILLNNMLDPGFDQDEHGDSIETVFDRLYFVIKDEKFKAIECGSIRMRDTPKSLFRLLYLTETNEPIRDLYKGVFIWITDSKKKLLAEYGFYKYEAGLFFNCPLSMTNRRKTIFGSEIELVCGGFGGNNKIYCKDQVSALWFWTLARILHTELDVYPGNFFKV